MHCSRAAGQVVLLLLLLLLRPSLRLLVGLDGSRRSCRRLPPYAMRSSRHLRYDRRSICWALLARHNDARSGGRLLPTLLGLLLLLLQHVLVILQLLLLPLPLLLLIFQLLLPALPLPPLLLPHWIHLHTAQLGGHAPVVLPIQCPQRLDLHASYPSLILHIHGCRRIGVAAEGVASAALCWQLPRLVGAGCCCCCCWPVALCCLLHGTGQVGRRWLHGRWQRGPHGHWGVDGWLRRVGWRRLSQVARWCMVQVGCCWCWLRSVCLPRHTRSCRPVCRRLAPIAVRATA
jgi:hypothetical protein